MFDNIPDTVDEVLESSNVHTAVFFERKDDVKKRIKPHKLGNKWKVWYHHATPGISEQTEVTVPKESQLKVSLLNVFDTVEGFWSVYRQLEIPSRTACGNCFQIFPNGEAPAESKSTRTSGGKFSFILLGDAQLDLVWERLLLAIVGGQLESMCSSGAKGDHRRRDRFFSGIIFGKRKVGGRFVLLTRNRYMAKEEVPIVAKALRTLCDLSRKISIEYRWYSDNSELHLRL